MKMFNQENNFETECLLTIRIFSNIRFIWLASTQLFNGGAILKSDVCRVLCTAR